MIKMSELRFEEPSRGQLKVYGSREKYSDEMRRLGARKSNGEHQWTLRVEKKEELVALIESLDVADDVSDVNVSEDKEDTQPQPAPASIRRYRECSASISDMYSSDDEDDEFLDMKQKLRDQLANQYESELQKINESDVKNLERMSQILEKKNIFEKSSSQNTKKYRRSPTGIAYKTLAKSPDDFHRFYNETYTLDSAALEARIDSL